MKNKYGIRQVAGNNSVQFVINGNVIGDVKIFRQQPEESSFELVFYYRGTNRNIEFDDDTVKAFNAWYALPPENEFKVYVREAETGNVNNRMSLAIKRFLRFIKSETFASQIVKQYINSEIYNDMRTYYNFETDAEKERFILFAFCCITIANILKPKSVMLDSNIAALCGYMQTNGKEYHFPIDIDKATLEEYCDGSNVLDYCRLLNTDCPGYYVSDLGGKIVSRTVLPEFFLWLSSINDTELSENPHIEDLAKYKLAAR